MTTQSQTASEALRKAKEANGIDADAKRIGPKLFIRDRYNPGRYCVVYKYKNKNGEYIYIRKDNETRYGNSGGNGDQPAHFNVLRSIKKKHGCEMESYNEALKDYSESENNQDQDLGQHHYFEEDDIEEEDIEEDDTEEYDTEEDDIEEDD